MNLKEALKLLKNKGFIFEASNYKWADVVLSKIANIDKIQLDPSENDKLNFYINFMRNGLKPVTLGVLYKAREDFDGAVDVYKKDGSEKIRFTAEKSSPEEAIDAINVAKLSAEDLYIIRFAVEDSENADTKKAIFNFLQEFAKETDTWDFGGIKHVFKPVSYKIADEETILVACQANDIENSIKELNHFWNSKEKEREMDKAGVYVMRITFNTSGLDNFNKFESVKVSRALKILKENGYLVEIRDSSNPLDKETEVNVSWRDPYQKISWNKVTPKFTKDKESFAKDKIVANTMNKLIEQVDNVCNRFEDYDYYVTRHSSNMIHIKKAEGEGLDLPFLQIAAYINDDGKSAYFECTPGRVEQDVRKKFYATLKSPEDVLKWVSKALSSGIIN